MKTSKQTDETRALKKQFWKNVVFLMDKVGLDEDDFSFRCDYTLNGFQSARVNNCLSLDMALVICKQLAEPLDDMFFKDYKEEWELAEC